VCYEYEPVYIDRDGLADKNFWNRWRWWELSSNCKSATSGLWAFDSSHSGKQDSLNRWMIYLTQQYNNCVCCFRILIINPGL
jgi:hypothetical protein